MKENYHSVDDKIMLDEEERRGEAKAKLSREALK
jgi:hypothetical protein